VEPPPPEPMRKGGGPVEAGADDNAAYERAVQRS